MTQEEKQLLLKDLCARLPYGVICNGNDKFDALLTRMCPSGDYCDLMHSPFAIETVKPYLRPMSSMTEEEEVYYNTVYTTLKFYEKEDWLNAHHFDYRGLIPMGLALEAKEGRYNTSEKWTPLRNGLKENEDGQIVGGVKL